MKDITIRVAVPLNRKVGVVVINGERAFHLGTHSLPGLDYEIQEWSSKGEPNLPMHVEITYGPESP